MNYNFMTGREISWLLQAVGCVEFEVFMVVTVTNWLLWSHTLQVWYRYAEISE